MRYWIRLISIIVGAGLTSHVTAVTVQYHPDGVARLGYGYDVEKPFTNFVRPCIVADGVENIDTQNGAVTGSIELTELSDRRSLLTTLGVSVDMEAHGSMYSGSTSFSQNVAATFDESTLVWTATIKTNFGRFRLRNPRAAQILINAATPSDALRMCGPEIITQETRGAVAAVVFELRDISSTDKQDMRAAIAANFSGGVSGGSGNSQYKTSMERAMRKSSIKTYVHVQGGPGTSALYPIIQAPSDLNVIRKTLSDYVAKTDEKNAKPLTYLSSPITQFAKLQFNAPPDVAQDRLYDIYEYYSNVTALVRRIDELIKPTGPSDSYLIKYVPDTKRKQLASTRSKYEEARSALRGAGLKCIQSKPGCAVPSSVLTLPRLDWPAIPPAPFVVGVSHCTSPLLAVVGSPPAETGKIVAYESFKLGVSGDPLLLAQAYLVAPDGRVPLQLLSVNEALAPDALPRLGTDRCTDRNVDRATLFGGLRVYLDARKDVPLQDVEIQDKFGRRAVYRLDLFQ